MQLKPEEISKLIKEQIKHYENKIAQMAHQIEQANIEQGTRVVLISGPSSSGKTTTAKRLGIQLRILGLDPVLISLDDYFVDREHTPKDENGDYTTKLFSKEQTYKSMLKILGY